MTYRRIEKKKEKKGDERVQSPSEEEFALFACGILCLLGLAFMAFQFL